MVSVLLAMFVLAGCSTQAVVDEDSPTCTGAAIAAGSNLDEASQYVEVRLSFDGALESSGNAADDLEVKLNGTLPDAKTVQVEAHVEGPDVVVRLVPTPAAAEGGRVYFALYDGQLSVGAKREDGALAHVHVVGGTSSAVLGAARWFTVPSGVREQPVEGAGDAPSASAGASAPSVTFDITSFAQLRCCTWLSFADELPSVRLHNHQFYRDTERTCAQRLADTLNATYGAWFGASCDGARVTVWAVDGTTPLSVRIVEGPDALPGDDGGVGAWEGEA